MMGFVEAFLYITLTSYDHEALGVDCELRGQQPGSSYIIPAIAIMNPSPDMNKDSARLVA